MYSYDYTIQQTKTLHFFFELSYKQNPQTWTVCIY